MAYHIHACADVGGEKRNIELAFDRKPEEVTQLAQEVENVFRNEFVAKGLSAREFAVDFIVFYDDALQKWKPLERCSQLSEYTQIYVFQTNITNETIREIPPPMKQVSALAQSQRAVHRPGIGTVAIDKAEAVFKEMDINDNRQIELDEMLHAFAAAGIDFNEETVSRLFEKSDANNDGRITWEEFLIFAELFPNTVETLYWRLCHFTEAHPRNPVAQELKEHRRKEHQMRRELEQMEQRRRLLESNMRQQQAAAREMDPRRRFLEDEEQDLINKEFALQFHRDMVIQAESQFSETAVRFDHAAMRQGSPRRARFL